MAEIDLTVVDETPIAYDESSDPDRFWKTDPYDAALPKQRGFLTDLVYFMRGMEVPTIYTLWSGLWLLSATVKREAWLQWYPDDLFLNLYIILAGPAGMKKSTTIDAVGYPIINMMSEYIANKNVQKMKNVTLVKDKMTPESLLDAMLPGNRPGKVAFRFEDEEGKPIPDGNGGYLRYKATSEIGVILSEMSSSIGKKSYTEGFVEILLDLYNPRDRWEWRTKGGGLKVFPRTYMSFLAATTPASFKESIPKVATGDGFLSRCVVVYAARNNRRFSMPRKVPNGPTIGELAHRLAWIAEHTMGEYRLTPEAFELYDSWYNQHKDYMEQSLIDQGIRGRMDINLLKVATLIRAQRYDAASGPFVELSDVEDAINILQVTYTTSQELLADLEEGIVPTANKVLGLIMKKRLTRTELMRKSHIPANELNEVLDYLNQCGRIRIISKGKIKGFPSKDGNEIYEAFTEEEENGKKESAPSAINQ